MLLEALVAIVLFLVGVLGILGLQAGMARAQTESSFRSEAAYLAQELQGLMWADTNKLSDFAISGSSCTAAACQRWLEKTKATLPGGGAVVTISNIADGSMGGDVDKGRLFVVNAATGAMDTTRSIATTAGNTTTPAGLAKINVWVKALNDNTAQRFYAGDLLGNVWRFDVDDKVLPHKSALLLAQMQDAKGKAQPITTEPKLREYDKQPIVVVATGQYLDRTDIDNTDTQSIAAIRDPLTDAKWDVVRNATKFKKVTVSKSGKTASGAAVTMEWATDGGWWADFPTGGERVSMPMEWDGARLLAATTIPDGDQCKSGGASWLYAFGLANGTTNGKEFDPDALIVGFSVVRNDKGDPKIIVRTSDNKTKVEDGSGLGGGTTIKRARRVSWRELN